MSNFDFDHITDYGDSDAGFSPDQMRAIALFAAGHNTTSVAREISSTSDTVKRWMSDTHFRLAVKVAISNILGDTLAEAVRETGDTLKYLVEVRDSEEETTRNRLAAASKILEIAANYKATIDDERLMRVESQLRQQENY